MSKVSIVVPVYNAGKRLEKCIASILNQTFDNFELILVNDGSTDQSLAICKKFQNKDSRVIVIDKKNEGSITARKTGVHSAKSDYIMFVDADDWIDNKTLRTLYDEALEHQADITVCNMYRVLGGMGLIKKPNSNKYFVSDKVYNEQEIRTELIVSYLHGHTFPSSLCAKLYKKELLLNTGKYLERIHFMGDDLFYNLEVLLKASKVKMIDKPLYYYRMGGFTSKYMPYLFDDMINGYLIQEEIIQEQYQDSKQIRYNGISVMLLNTFKSCLCNLFSSNLNEFEIKKLINKYVLNNVLIKCLSNERCMEYFEKEYLDAIKNKEIEYLYQMGKRMYKSARPKRAVKKILSKIC